MERQLKIQIEYFGGSFNYHQLNFEQMLCTTVRRHYYHECHTDSKEMSQSDQDYFVGKKSKPSLGKRRSRTNFSSYQLLKLEAIFQSHHYPDVTACHKLSTELNLSGSTIQVWFQNRRAKWRRDENTRRGPGRPASSAPRTTCSGDPLPAEEILKKFLQKNIKKKQQTSHRGVTAIFDQPLDDASKQRCFEQSDWSTTGDQSSIRSPMQSMTNDILPLKPQELPRTIVRRSQPRHPHHPNQFPELHGRIKPDIRTHLPFNIENLLSP